MKDKEMAEQFADNVSGLELTCSILAAKDKNHVYRLGRYEGFLAGLKAGRPQWHKLDWEKDFPDVDKLVRVRTKSGAEYICETYSYFPAEDEIGYGSVITQFSELNGDWVDDNEIEYWCEIPTFDKE